jgi:hypothetical protein
MPVWKVKTQSDRIVRSLALAAFFSYILAYACFFLSNDVAVVDKNFVINQTLTMPNIDLGVFIFVQDLYAILLGFIVFFMLFYYHVIEAPEKPIERCI